LFLSCSSSQITYALRAFFDYYKTHTRKDFEEYALHNAQLSEENENTMDEREVTVWSFVNAAATAAAAAEPTPVCMDCQEKTRAKGLKRCYECNLKRRREKKKKKKEEDEICLDCEEPSFPLRVGRCNACYTRYRRSKKRPRDEEEVSENRNREVDRG
jgi:hypothetical protein